MLADRSLPATVANSFPPLAGVPGGVEACVDVLVRYVGSGHNMAMCELSYSLFLERFSAGGVGGVYFQLCQYFSIRGNPLHLFISTLYFNN